MKLQTLVMLAFVVATGWWLFKSRLVFFKARMARALRVGGIAYMAILAVRLATSPPDQEQLEVAALALAFFGALWGVAWLVTKVMGDGDG